MDQSSMPSPDRPRIVDGRPLLIAGLRGHYTASTMQGLPAQWQRFAPHIGRVPGQVGIFTYGLCFEGDGGLDYLSGVEVADMASLPGDFSSIRIPAQRYAAFAHRGHVSEIWTTVQAIWRQGLRESGLEAAPTAGLPDFFERYGEGFDPRQGRGDIEIWIPIRD